MKLPFLTTLLAFVACVAFAGPVSAEPGVEPFAIVPGSFQIAPSTGQAGAHENLTTSFDFAHEASGPEAGKTHNDVRTIVVNLPAGFNASDTAVPTCPLADLLGYTGEQDQLPPCPVASQVGQISFELANLGAGLPPAHPTVPLYNMEVTSFGVTAELGFKTKVFSTTLQVSVRPGDDGLTITTPNIPKDEIRNVSVTVWGVPAAHEHDAQRGEVCGAEFEIPALCHNELGGPQAANIAIKPFLANPTSCGPFTASIEADSWESPDTFTPLTGAEVGPIGECDRVPFEPSLEAHPTTTSAESPSGLNVSLVVPQAWENPYSLATANLEDTTVTLPPGFTINPGAGEGLGACTPAQYAAETSSSLPGEGCPTESKIGSIEIETPILAEKIEGAVYVATPYDNPFSEPDHPGGSLLALYVVAKDPERGILIKVAGKIALDPVTGQLTTTFENTPQQPFSKFTLKFRPGATAPLVSPPACGAYSVQAALTPWSSELNEPRLVSGESFQITQGVHEGPCPSGGVPPFKPQAIAGTENNAAGSYSPFYLRVLREDGEQELTRFSTTMPPGLTGNLTGIPFCPDADIQAAKEVSGSQELSSPSCPAASEVGHSIVGAGVGTVLAQTPGKLYLAGPYNGAPLSLVSITSAVVGPFDLGSVVIRFALNVNPSTAQVEVSANGSDPIPHIIKGIVVHVRDIRVYINRPNFIINSTSCNPLGISNIVSGAGADFTNPADQVPVTVSSRYQAASCASLAFKPKFSASTEAKDHFNETGASLTVKLSANQGPSPTTGQASEANIAKVKVELPVSLPSRLTTLQKACVAKVFEANPANCPPDSFIGHAVVHTPILPVPLTGPAIFVSHGGEAFPSLILVLQGYGVTIDLTGATFISHAGITSSTFKTVPDQPFSSFELTLPTGKFSALAAITNVCKPVKTETVKKKVKVKVSKTVSGKRVTKTKTVTKKVSETVAAPLLMPTEMVAQNGAVLKQTTKITVTGCKAVKPAKKKAKARKKAKRKKK